jgi:hypothetical protein
MNSTQATLHMHIKAVDQYTIDIPPTFGYLVQKIPTGEDFHISLTREMLDCGFGLGSGTRTTRKWDLFSATQWTYVQSSYDTKRY